MSPKAPALNTEHPQHASPFNGPSMEEANVQISTPKSHNSRSAPPLLDTPSWTEPGVQISALGPQNHGLAPVSEDSPIPKTLEPVNVQTPTEIEDLRLSPLSPIESTSKSLEPSVQISTTEVDNLESPLISGDKPNPEKLDPAVEDPIVESQNQKFQSESAGKPSSKKLELDARESVAETEDTKHSLVFRHKTNPEKPVPTIQTPTVEFQNPVSRPVTADKSGFKKPEPGIKISTTGHQDIKPQDLHSPRKLEAKIRSQSRSSSIAGVQKSLTYWKTIRDNFSKLPVTSRQLVVAANKGDTRRVLEILADEAGITLTPEDIVYWKGALKAAAEANRWEAVDLLLNVWGKIRNSTAVTAAELSTVIDEVAAGGEVFSVRLLMKGIAANGKSKEVKRTNLQLAAGKGYVSAVKLLMDDCDVNEFVPEQHKGRTALQAAAEGGHEEIVKLLLEKGANINAPPAQYKGRTALQAAAGGGHKQVVELLLEKGRGVQINAPASASDGRTALQAAAEKGHEEIVKLLVDRGADIDAKPAAIGGISAIEAAKGKHESISEYFRGLTTHGLHSSCRNETKIEEFRKLLEEEASKTTYIINSRDSAGQTPLHIAAIRPVPFKEAVRLLLEKGARTDMTDLDDRNPLESAIFELLKVRELEEKRKEIDMKKTTPDDQTLQEPTPLNKADGLLKIILLLLEHGAAPHAHNIDQSLAWRKIFPCPEGQSDEILELKEIRYPDPEKINGSGLSSESKETQGEISNKGSSMCYRPIKNKLSYMSFEASILSIAEMKTTEKWIPDYIAPKRSLCLELLKPPAEPRPNEQPRPATLLRWLPCDPNRTDGWNTDLPRLTSVYNSPIIIKYSIKYEFFVVVGAADCLKPHEDPAGDKPHEHRTHLKPERRAGHISWTMLALANQNDNRSSGYQQADVKVPDQVKVQTVRYRSTLNHRWIPNHSLEFFILFFDDLHKIWEELLTTSRNHLDEDHGELLMSKYGQEQTSKATFYLEHLFADARTWSQFRAQLTSHVQICNKTLNQYKGESFFSWEIKCANVLEKDFREELAVLSERVTKFESRFKDEISALEIKTQGLVEFKLNLLQAYESQRSNTTAVGMKRLSWITFIFLPSMFVASLFGMNINILSGGPDWTWYPLICVPVLVAVIATWLACKCIEEYLQNKRLERKKRSRDSDIEAHSFSTFHMRDMPYLNSTRKSKHS